MRFIRQAVMSAICSVTLALASIPSVAMADASNPVSDLRNGVPRPAMPHIDDSQLIDDGSFYYDIITSANASGEPVRSADYVYGAVEPVQPGSGTVSWVPVRPNDSPNGECVYERGLWLCIQCEVNVDAVPDSLRKSSDLMFDPVAIQLLDEDNQLLDETYQPLTGEEKEGWTPADRLEFSTLHPITLPSQQYVLHLTDSRSEGDTTQDIAFFVDDNQDFIILNENEGGEFNAGLNEQHETDMHNMFHTRTMYRRFYPSGAVLTINMQTHDLRVEYKHTEFLYDPTAQDEEFTSYLAREHPEGCSATVAEYEWANIWAFRDLTKAVSSQSAYESSDETKQPSHPLTKWVVIGAVAASFLIVVVVGIATSTRKAPRRSQWQSFPNANSGHYDPQ